MGPQMAIKLFITLLFIATISKSTATIPKTAPATTRLPFVSANSQHDASSTQRVTTTETPRIVQAKSISASVDQKPRVVPGVDRDPLLVAASQQSASNGEQQIAAPSVQTVHQVWTSTSSGSLDELSPEMIGKLRNDVPFLAAYALRPRLVGNQASGDTSQPAFDELGRPIASYTSGQLQAPPSMITSLDELQGDTLRLRSSPSAAGSQSQFLQTSASSPKRSAQQLQSTGVGKLGDFNEFKVETSSTSKSEHHHKRKTTLRRSPKARGIRENSDDQSLNLKRRVISDASRLIKNQRRGASSGRSGIARSGSSRRRKNSTGVRSRAGRLRRKMNRGNLNYHMNIIRHGKLQASPEAEISKNSVDGGEVKGGGASTSGKKPFYSNATPRPEDSNREPVTEPEGDEEEEDDRNSINSSGRGRSGTEWESADGSSEDRNADHDDNNDNEKPKRVGQDDVEEEGDTVTVMPKFDGVDDDPEVPIEMDEGGESEDSERRDSTPGTNNEDDRGEDDAGRVARDRPDGDSGSTGGEGGSAVVGGGGIGATIGGGGSNGGDDDGNGDGDGAGIGSGGQGTGTGKAAADDDNAENDAGERRGGIGGEGSGTGSEGVSTSGGSGDATGTNDDNNDSDVDDRRSDPTSGGGDEGGKGSGMEFAKGDRRDESSGGSSSSTTPSNDSSSASSSSQNDGNLSGDFGTRNSAEGRKSVDGSRARGEGNHNVDDDDVDYRDEIDQERKHKDKEERYSPTSSGHGHDSHHCDYDHHGGHHDEHHHHHHGIKWLRDAVPGEPGDDYPILSRTNATNFNCREQKNPGYYADVESRCQIFHICQADGRQDSFLCPNGTIFSQRSTVCVWWNSFDCEDAPKYYHLNALLYKPMLSMGASPSTPDSSSGSEDNIGGNLTPKPLNNGSGVGGSAGGPATRRLRPKGMRVAGEDLDDRDYDGDNESSSIDGLIKAMKRKNNKINSNGGANAANNSNDDDDRESTIQRKSTSLEDVDADEDTETQSSPARLRNRGSLANAGPRPRRRRASIRQMPPKLKSRRVSRNSRRRKLRHGIKPKRRA